jgi:hypothetical protein
MLHKRHLFGVIQKLTLLLVGVSCMILADTAVGQVRAGCDRLTVAVQLSPDDEWAALVQESVCTDGAFVTVMTDVVQLVRHSQLGKEIRLAWQHDQANHEGDVFGLDIHGHREDRPRLRWLSSTKLQITVPNKSLIGLQKASYEGIEIVVKFDPDDPAERQRFLQETERFLKEGGKR